MGDGGTQPVEHQPQEVGLEDPLYGHALSSVYLLHLNVWCAVCVCARALCPKPETDVHTPDPLRKGLVLLHMLTSKTVRFRALHTSLTALPHYG